MATISTLEKKLIDLDKKLDQRFNGIDQKFDGIDQKFNGIDQKFDGIDQRFNGIDQKFDGIDQRIIGVDQRLDGVDQKMKGLATMEALDDLAIMVKNNIDLIYKKLDQDDDRFDRIENVSIGNHERRIENIEDDIRILKTKTGLGRK